MHYLGFVFVKEPTEKAVDEAMYEHGGDNGRHWDWYRCGGRWDGWFDGDVEMKARETDNGFNFSDKNNIAARNCRRVSDLPKYEKCPVAFFVTEYNFVPRDHYDEFAISPYETKSGEKHYGAIVPTPDYEERFARAIQKHSNEWVIVVDAHN